MTALTVIHPFAGAAAEPQPGGRPALVAGGTTGCTYVDPCSFDVETPMGGPSLTDNPGGKARAKGSISFATARSMQLNVDFVRDVCNSEGTDDGLKAYLYLDIQFMDGSELDWYPHATPFKDANGCATLEYRGDAGMTLSSSERRFKRARVWVVECDSVGCAFEIVFSTWKDNPYTG